MRHFVLMIFSLCTALFLATSAFAETIAPVDASGYVGASVSVEGVVSQVSTSNRGTTFLNFGGRYPNHVFYAVIFRNNAHKFPDVHALEGKTVAIKGEVELYKGKPQIIVTSPSQIELR